MHTLSSDTQSRVSAEFAAAASGYITLLQQLTIPVWAAPAFLVIHPSHEEDPGPKHPTGFPSWHLAQYQVPRLEIERLPLITCFINY